MITLTNDFHNTSVKIRAEIGDSLTENQVKRAKKSLCGIRGCNCSGCCGERGAQSGFMIIQTDNHEAFIQPNDK